MRKCFCDRQPERLTNGGTILSWGRTLRSYSGRFMLASVVAVIAATAGCDPKPPAAEDLGTILPGVPIPPDADEEYEFPEDLRDTLKEIDRKKLEENM